MKEKIFRLYIAMPTLILVRQSLLVLFQPTWDWGFSFMESIRCYSKRRCCQNTYLFLLFVTNIKTSYTKFKMQMLSKTSLDIKIFAKQFAYVKISYSHT